MGTEPVNRREELARASAARAQRDRDVGILEICVGGAIFAIPCLILFVLWKTGVVTNDATGYLLIPEFVVAVLMIRRGLRIRAHGGDEVLADDDRPPIVYLRPFGSDGTIMDEAMSSRVRASPWERYMTHEERLGRTLRKVGPVVAVGDPTERLPRLGAARVYAADEDWQMTVDELTARAGVVVLQTGDSDGLAWEVDHVIALGSPERVIIVLPAPGGRRKRQKHYDAFRRRFGDLFPRRLPEAIGDCQFVFFDADWTPRLLGKRGVPVPAGDVPRDLALRRLAREYKIKWAPRWVRIATFVLALFAVSGIVQLLNGNLASSIRVGGCKSNRVAELKRLEPPFATTDSAIRVYAEADCQAIDDKHLLAGGGKLASPAATRLRCERYTRALYDYESPDRRGARSRWVRVAAVYCATPGAGLLETAAEVNGP